MAIKKTKRILDDKDVENLFASNDYKFLEIVEKKYRKSRVVCPNNHIVEMSYYNFKKGHRCKVCSAIERKKSQSFSYSHVKTFIESHDCFLVSKKYVNVKGNLKIICNCGNIYETSFEKFKNGSRCRNCKSKKISKSLTIDYNTIETNLRKIGFEIIDKFYENVNKPVSLIDCHGYKYSTTYSLATRKNSVIRKFGVNNKYTLENINLWLESNDKNFVLVSKEFSGTTNYLLFQCKTCNEIFKNKWSNICCSGQGCPYCAIISKKTLRKNSFGALYPHTMKYWSYAKNNVDPYKTRPKSNKKFWFICEKCNNEYEMVLSNRVKTKGLCPYCRISGMGAKPTLEKSLNSLFPELSKEWDYKKNKKTPVDYRAFSGINVWWICPSCGNSWNSRIIDRSTNNGGNCTKCNLSSYELKIFNFLRNHGIPFEFQYKFDDLRNENNVMLRYDFAIFDNAGNIILLVEYDGLQHDKYIKHFHKNKKTFFRQQRNDFLKNEYTLKNSIPFLRIKHEESDNIENLLIDKLNVEEGMNILDKKK